MLLCAKGDLDGAEPLLRKVVEVGRETLGDRHPKTLAFANNLESLLRAKFDLDDA